MTTLQRLEALQNRPTRYELIAERGNERILICYSMRTGRHSMLDGCRKFGDKLIARLGITDTDMLTWQKPARLGAVLGQWSVRFSGRTQREAISQGELEFIGDYNA